MSSSLTSLMLGGDSGLSASGAPSAMGDARAVIALAGADAGGCTISLRGGLAVQEQGLT